VIFRPGLLSHPADELRPAAHTLSQRVLETLIAHQDWFMADVPPPPRNDSVVLAAGAGEAQPMPSAGDPTRPRSTAALSGWSVIEPEDDAARVTRRRTLAEQGGRAQFELPADLSPLDEAAADGAEDVVLGGDVTVTRSRTLPSAASTVVRRRSRRTSNAGAAHPEQPARHVLRKTRPSQEALR
jgi:hypothetical protein